MVQIILILFILPEELIVRCQKIDVNLVNKAFFYSGSYYACSDGHGVSLGAKVRESKNWFNCVRRSTDRQYRRDILLWLHHGGWSLGQCILFVRRARLTLVLNLGEQKIFKYFVNCYVVILINVIILIIIFPAFISGHRTQYEKFTHIEFLHKF